MATKKRKHSKVHSVSEPGRKRRRSHRTRVTHRRSKGVLGEMFDKRAASESAKGLLNGALAGLIVVFGNKLLLKDMKIGAKAAILAGASFLAGSVLKSKEISAAMAGASAIIILQDSGLGEAGETINLDMLPAVIAPGINDGNSLQEQYGALQDVYNSNYIPSY